MAEIVDHISLSGFASPVRSPSKRAAVDAVAWWSDVGGNMAGPGGEVDSPLDGWELELSERRSFRQSGPALHQSGWLLKAYGEGPQRMWRNRFLFLTADRLCYTADTEAEGVRYLPLDRIPVRALPRGYGPKLGVTLVEDRQVDRSNPQFSPKKAGCVFSVACGSHTHFFAAPSPAEARAWVDAITAAWLQCVKHTARRTHSPTAEEALVLREARWRAHSEVLRRSAADAEQARLRESMAAWQTAAAATAAVQPADDQVVCYDIEVVTGAHPDAGTTSKVYLELCGDAGASGEHRLMYRESTGRAAFAAGATDAFRLHCQQLGRLFKVRVYHSNAGPHPAWLLEEVRVRRQGAPAWTIFPCGRWLAVHQDDGRVMRELHSASTQTAEPAQQAAVPAPPLPAPPSLQTETAATLSDPADKPDPSPAAVERVAQQTWYTVVVCTGDSEGAGLAPAVQDSGSSPSVFVVLHGSRGASQRVKLPAQAGDFERGQEDVFRVQLPCVGTLEKISVGLSSAGQQQSSWLLDQVEVTDETTGETVFFPCSAWLGTAKGTAERSVMGSRINPREAQRELARLRKQADVATQQLAEAKAELAAARAAAQNADQVGEEQQAELQGKLAAVQAEVARLKAAMVEARAGASHAEEQAEELRAELARAQEKAAGLKREQEAGRQREGAEASRAAALAAQVQALHNELAEVQEAAAAAAARARKCEAEARRAEDALDDLRSQHDRRQQESNTSAADTDADLRRLRAEVATKAAELREARDAEAEYSAECERLSGELAAERLRTRERLEEAEREAAAAREAAAKAAAGASSQPATPASAKRQAAYRVSVHTCVKPPQAGTCLPVWLELMGSHGSSGPVELGRQGSPGCFASGATDVFLLEVADVGELIQLNLWVDAGADSSGGSDGASWRPELVEVEPRGVGAPRPAFFVCNQWLDAHNGYRVELPASSRHPRGVEVEYQVVVYTSGMAVYGTVGNVCMDLMGDQASSGVLTLRNRGGSFRPAQNDTFTFRLPNLGSLSKLRVGHDGRKDWHLEKVEVVDTTTGTTFTFPCARRVPPGAMSRAVQLQGYTTDPASLPVRYRLELDVQGVEGGPVLADSLRFTLFGTRGESEVQSVDASRAVRGRLLVASFEADNVGTMERLRIGLAPTPEGEQCGLLVGCIAVTNMHTGEAASFRCSEWLRSTHAYDLELDAQEDSQGQDEELCVYRVEVQTSDKKNAGTAGSVFITIIGEGCTVGPYVLPNTNREHFQQGHFDVFEIAGAPDCGQLQQIDVRHEEDARSSGGWHLAWIKVTNLTTSAVAMFKSDCWVDKCAGANPGAVGVASALPPDQAAAVAGSQRSARDRALLGKRGSVMGKLAGALKGHAALAAAALRAPLVQDQRFEADLGGVFETTVPRDLLAGPPGYRIAFHTSRICGSGTRAKVHFELTGSEGSSGVLHPVGTSRSFGAGRLDVFDYPHLPFLGELQSARVGTNATGFFPAWHLALLVVTHLPTGRVWQFSCYNWIDKKCNYSRWLQLDSIAHGSSKSQAACTWYAAPPTSAAYAPASISIAGSYVQGGSQYGAYMRDPHYSSGSGPSSPTRNAAQQQVQQSGSLVRGKLQVATRRPGSPARGNMWQQQQQQQHGWQHQRGSPRLLHTMSSGIPGSPRIAAARPRSAGRT